MPDQNPSLLFDIDGTLTDSDRIHILALNEILRPHRLNIDHHTYIHTIAGRMNAEFLSELVPALDVDAIRLMGHANAPDRAPPGAPLTQRKKRGRSLAVRYPPVINSLVL